MMVGPVSWVVDDLCRMHTSRNGATYRSMFGVPVFRLVTWLLATLCCDRITSLQAEDASGCVCRSAACCLQQPSSLNITLIWMYVQSFLRWCQICYHHLTGSTGACGCGAVDTPVPLDTACSSSSWRGWTRLIREIWSHTNCGCLCIRSKARATLWSC
jgi:hypothetical protein